MQGRLGRHEDAVSITTAPMTPSDEIAVRQRRYLISMAIRTACVILAVVFRETWAVWFLVAGAVILPYVAVVLANTASPRPNGPAPEAPTHRELG